MGATACVADEWALVRRGVRALLEDAGVRVRSSGPSATNVIGALTSGDVFVVGWCPDMTTEHATRRASALGAAVVALAPTLDRTHVLALCAAGASAVLDRAATEMELAPVLDHLARGQRFLGTTVVDAVFSSAAPRSMPVGPLVLSDRERAVLEQLATGRTNREIAAALHIGAETVKTHLSNVYAKLGVRRRDQAVATALRAGLL